MAACRKRDNVSVLLNGNDYSKDLLENLHELVKISNVCVGVEGGKLNSKSVD